MTPQHSPSATKSAPATPPAARRVSPELALLFPGQGSQAPRMLQALNQALPGFGAARARLNALLGPIEGRDVERWLSEHSAADLKRTDVAQAALCLVERALLEALEGLGIRAGFAIGHSFGELVALSASGALDASTLCTLSRARGACMAKAAKVPSGMLAVRTDMTTLQDLTVPEEQLWVANDNAPGQIVVAGTDKALDAFAARAKRAKVATVKLQTAAAFHTPLMDAARAELAVSLSQVSLTGPTQCQVISNVTAQPYSASAGDVARTLTEQVTSPVRFRESIETAYALGARVFLEVGPGQVLSGLVAKILGSLPHQILHLDPGDADAAIHVAEVLRQLIQEDATPMGRPTDATAAFFENNRLAVEAFFEQQRLFVEQVGQSAGDRLGLFREIVQTNREVLRDFLSTQQAALAPSVLPPPQSLPPPVRSPQPERASSLTKPAAPASEGKGSRAQAVEVWLCEAIAELTGFPRSLVKPESELENELGLDSITLLEVFTRLADAFPELSGKGAEIRKARSIKDAVQRMLGTASMAETPPVPTAPVEVKSEDLPSQQGSPVARSMLQLLEMSVGRPLSSADLTRDFTKGLGLDAFTRRELVQRLVSAFPDLGVAGRELAFAATPRELLTLCEGVLGEIEAEGVQRFVQVHEPVLSSGELPALTGPLWVVSSPCKQREWVLAGLSEAKIRHQLVDLSVTPGEQSLALRKLLAEAPQPNLLFVTSEAEPTHIEGWFRFAKLVGEQGAPARISLLGTRSMGHAAVVGLLRGLAHEWKGTPVRAVTVEGVLDAERCQLALATLLAGATDLDLSIDAHGVSHKQLRELSLHTQPSDLTRIPERAHVLLVGGGDGITARVAEMLAKRAHCKISAIGRTLLPAADPYPEAQTDSALRAVLREELSRELPGLDAKTLSARLSARVSFVRRERSLLGTKARIEALGSSFAYASADARDKASLARAIEQLKLAHGPIQGFVHGAGIIEDAPLTRKSEESFSRVFDTKLKSALNARDLLAQEPLRFALLFSSLTAWTGNVGQLDYIAGNQALDALSAEWNLDAPYPVRSLAFSVWHESGLAPGWAKALIAQDRRGGISDTEGVQRVWDELVRGDKATSWALLAPPSAFRFIERGGLEAREGSHG